MACKGVAAPVAKKQTDTGIKDAYTQFWIEKLIDISRKRQKQGQTVKQIEKDLMSFVDTHSDAVYNPYLTLKCE
jgi:hypothetical protein